MPDGQQKTQQTQTKAAFFVWTRKQITQNNLAKKSKIHSLHKTDIHYTLTGLITLQRTVMQHLILCQMLCQVFDKILEFINHFWNNYKFYCANISEDRCQSNSTVIFLCCHVPTAHSLISSWSLHPDSSKQHKKTSNVKRSGFLWVYEGGGKRAGWKISKKQIPYGLPCIHSQHRYCNTKSKFNTNKLSLVCKTNLHYLN